MEPKPKTGTVWQGYFLDLTDEQVVVAFAARYGQEPQSVWRDGGCVHAGPITETEHNGTLGQYSALWHVSTPATL